MPRILANLCLRIWTSLVAPGAGWLAREEGQGLTEYALILALIAIVAVAALTLLGGRITSALSTVSNSLAR